jgi:hypothetical protein
MDKTFEVVDTGIHFLFLPLNFLNVDQGFFSHFAVVIIC